MRQEEKEGELPSWKGWKKGGFRIWNLEWQKNLSFKYLVYFSITVCIFHSSTDISYSISNFFSPFFLGKNKNSWCLYLPFPTIQLEYRELKLFWYSNYLILDFFGLSTNEGTIKGWILLNVRTMPKILRYLIKVSTLLSNIRFLASFRRLEESTQRFEYFEMHCPFRTCLTLREKWPAFPSSMRQEAKAI